MKKTILKVIIFSFALCLTVVSNAQIEKGMKVVTGTISYQNNNSKTQDSINYQDSKSHTIGLSPKIGLFLSDNFCIGIAVPLKYSSGNNNYTYEYPTSNNKLSFKTHTFNYAVSPYATYYKKIADKFYGYISGSVSFGLQNSNNKRVFSYTDYLSPINNSSSIIKTNSYGYNYSANLNFGLTYFISPKVAIEASLGSVGYTGSSTSTKDKSYENYIKNSGFYSSIVTNGLGLGLSYYFK